MDGFLFLCIFCHSLHLGFTFPTSLYSSSSLCLVIWKCCSRGTTFTVRRSHLRSCYLSIPEEISLMDFHYFSINGCFTAYFRTLNQEQNQTLAKRQKSRAKGHLKCVPKTIMGSEDCAAPHISFFWKSVRAQVHLWNIHSLSLSDFSCTEDLLQNWQLCWSLLCSSPEPLSWPPLPLLRSDLVYLQQDFGIPKKYPCVIMA